VVIEEGGIGRLGALAGAEAKEIVFMDKSRVLLCDAVVPSDVILRDDLNGERKGFDSV
jgi:hypothetical protein